MLKAKYGKNIKLGGKYIWYLPTVLTLEENMKKKVGSLGNYYFLRRENIFYLFHFVPV